jgi:hypothetical protein
MGRKTYAPEQIINKLRKGEALSTARSGGYSASSNAGKSNFISGIITGGRSSADDVKETVTVRDKFEGRGDDSCTSLLATVAECIITKMKGHGRSEKCHKGSKSY